MVCALHPSRWFGAVTPYWTWELGPPRVRVAYVKLSLVLTILRLTLADVLADSKLR